MEDKNYYLTLLVKLIATGRPSTGVYAFLLTLLGFKYISWEGWLIGISAAFVFALVAMSIMTFNDIVDAPNDRRKLKLFASDNRGALIVFWLIESVVIALALIWVMTSSLWLGIFCATVWIVGLGYSFIPHWYVVQNIIVALCSGSPALCAAIYTNHLDKWSVTTFALFVSIIWLNECYKDSQDETTDRGYKKTLPTELGWDESWLRLVSALHIVGAVFFWHPNWWLQFLAVTIVPWLARDQVLARDDRKNVLRPLKTIRTTIKVVGLILYTT